MGTPTKTINYTYDSTWKVKLVSYNGQSITYDTIGNPLTYRNGMSFTWFGRQMEFANVNGTSITYKYNADGLRTEKKVGSTVHKYEYAGDKLFYEKRGESVVFGGYTISWCLGAEAEAHKMYNYTLPSKDYISPVEYFMYKVLS